MAPQTYTAIFAMIILLAILLLTVEYTKSNYAARKKAPSTHAQCQTEIGLIMTESPSGPTSETVCCPTKSTLTIDATHRWCANLPRGALTLDTHLCTSGRGTKTEYGALYACT